jgi:isoquinoline 1-oxidoreductase beta subunit
MGGIWTDMAMPCGKLTFKDGKPAETNFGPYRLIRMKEIPDVEAHFVDNGIDPTGLGEPALPPTGAVANAIFKATGTRLKTNHLLMNRF